MTALQPCVAGDIGDTRIVTLSGVADLTAVASIEAHVTRGTETATLVAAVTDAATNEVTIHLGTAGGWLPSAPTTGTWRGQIEVVFNDGSELTWPADKGSFTIVVQPQYG